MINLKANIFNFFFYPLIIIGVYGCVPNNQKKSPIELRATGEFLSIPIDNNTSNISDGLTYFSNPSLLFNLNWAQNSIQIYDFNTNEKIKELKFNYEGPEGVLDIMGIYVHSLDSIFLFNQLISQITLIDSSGRIKSKINYQTPDNYSPAFIHNAYFTSPPILAGNKMIVKTHYYGQISKMTQEELKTKQIVYEIDLGLGTSKILEFTFPDDYMLDGMKLFEASLATGHGKFVYSMFGDHRLFYKLDFGDTLSSKNGKSKFLPEKLALYPIGGGGLEYRKYAYYSPHYESLVFDPYRNVFIRFAFHAFEQDESVPISDMRNHSGPFSIQVFDSDLNLISETAFEPNLYHPFDFFIHEKGVYLSINHPLNPNNQEDKMTFELIEFVPIKK